MQPVAPVQPATAFLMAGKKAGKSLQFPFYATKT